MLVVLLGANTWKNNLLLLTNELKKEPSYCREYCNASIFDSVTCTERQLTFFCVFGLNPPIIELIQDFL